MVHHVAFPFSHPRDSWREEHCSTCDIMLDHAWSAQGKSCGQLQMTLPCADRSWSSMISQDRTVFFSPRISGMVLFFVQGSTKQLKINANRLLSQLFASLLYTPASFRADFSEKAHQTSAGVNKKKKKKKKKKRKKKKKKKNNNNNIKQQQQQTTTTTVIDHLFALLADKIKTPRQTPWSARRYPGMVSDFQ